jgi:SAM-dependent methyltransferase
MSVAARAPYLWHWQSVEPKQLDWMRLSPISTARVVFDHNLMSHTSTVTHCHLQYSSASFNACVSTLAIDVIPEADPLAAEMRRVTRPGGVVACGTFDFWGGNSVLDLVLDTGAVLDKSIRTLRAQIKARPIVWANGQANLWRQVGLVEVVELPIVLSFDYTDFEDYWSGFSTGPTRIAQRLTALPSGLRSDLQQYVRAGYLAGLPDGPRSFAVVVRAVRGAVP